MRLILCLLLLYPLTLLAESKALDKVDIVSGDLLALKNKVLNGYSTTAGVGKYHEPPILIAVRNDKLEAVLFLLKNGAGKFENREYGFTKGFPNPLPASLASYMFAQAFRTTNPIATVNLLLENLETKEYIDEILFYSISRYVKGSCNKCFALSEKLIMQGAKPTTIFTIDEVGGQSSALYATWPWESWPEERLTQERFKAHKYLLKWTVDNEGLSKDKIYKKYVQFE